MRSRTSAFGPLAAVWIALLGCGGGATTSGSGGSGGSASSSSSSASSSSSSTSSTGSSGTGGCAGQCVAGVPSGWDQPALLWIGDEAAAPTCPAGADVIAYEGHADLEAPFDCGTCTCGAPTGTCTLPTTMTANAATCALDGAATAHTPFDPASGWTGACDSNASIPAGKLCGGVKCVQSLTIGKLGISETGCTPSTPPAPAAPQWKTFARACKSALPVPCDSGHVCVPAPPSSSGFRVCMFQQGDVDCPSSSPYTEKHVFYGGIDDTRACSDCACGAPANSTCVAKISIYTDGACSTPAYEATVDAAATDCRDVPAGTPLGSKSATAPAYTPGACAPSGGAASGAATPKQPSTYCCLPP